MRVVYSPEPAEWKEALDSVIMREGTQRAEYILSELQKHAVLKNLQGGHPGFGR